MEIEIENENNEIRECFPEIGISIEETEIKTVTLKTNEMNEMCMNEMYDLSR